MQTKSFKTIKTSRTTPLIESLESRQLLSGVTPVILSDTVPSAAVSGSKFHGAIKLALTDSLPTAEQGFTVRIYASTSATLDTTVDPLVTSLAKSTTIKPLKTTALNVPITALPAGLPNGTYYLIAQTTDSAGNTDSVATNTTVQVAAPFVIFADDVSTTLPPSLISGSSVKGTVRVGLTNNGNEVSKGPVSINLTASTTPGVPGVSITTISKNLSVAVGKTVSVAIPVKTLPVLPDGTYSIVAQVTDPNGGVTVGSSPTLTIAAPFVTLSGTLASIVNVKAGATVFVTNSGNVADVTNLHGTFGITLDAAGTQPVGATVTLTSPKVNIKPGKTVTFHVKPSKAFLADLVTGVPYYLTVNFTDNTGNSGSAISNSFTV